MADSIFNSYCAMDQLSQDEVMMRDFNTIHDEGALDEPPQPRTRMKKVADVMFEYFVNNLLSNPMTQVKNLMSTTIPLVSRVYETGVTAGISQGMKFAGIGNGEVQFKEALAEAAGLGAGASDAFRFVSARLKSTGSQTTDAEILESIGLPKGLGSKTKLEYQQRQEIKADNFNIDNLILARGIDWLGWLINQPGRWLTATDITFKIMNYRAQVNKDAMRRALNSGRTDSQSIARAYELNRSRALSQDDPDAVSRAIDDAEQRTYTNRPDGEINRWMAEKGHDVWGLRWIVPFRRTMVNVLNYSIARTPLGVLQSATRTALMSADKAVQQEAIGRMAAGSMALIGLGYMIGDKIYGAAPRGKQQKELWEQDGRREYTLAIGDARIPLDALGQYSAFMKAYADYSVIASNANPIGDEDADPTVMNTAGELLLATADAMMEDHWVGGLSSFFTSVERAMRENDPAPIMREIGALTGSFVPKPVEYGVKKAYPEKIDRTGPFDALLSKLPVYAGSMPPVIGLWGDPVRHDHFLDPSLVSPATGKDPVATEILRLQMHVPVAERSPMGVGMSKEEYTQYMIYSGKGVANMPPLHTTLAKVMQSPAYTKLAHDKGKINIIRTVILDYRDAARDYMLMNSEWGKKAITRAKLTAQQRGEQK